MKKLLKELKDDMQHVTPLEAVRYLFFSRGGRPKNDAEWCVCFADSVVKDFAGSTRTEWIEQVEYELRQVQDHLEPRVRELLADKGPQ